MSVTEDGSEAEDVKKKEKKKKNRSRLVYNIKIIKRHISQLPTRVTSVYMFNKHTEC